jgi:23S rRNA (cytosine1962-C5)-methyltransferase
LRRVTPPARRQNSTATATAIETPIEAKSLSQTARTRVILKKGRANPVWRGHPWVYSGAVDRLLGAEPGGEPGELVDVCDADGHLIGTGFLNPRSQILVRMLTRGSLEAALPPSLLPGGLPEGVPEGVTEGLDDASSDSLVAVHALLPGEIERAPDEGPLSTLIAARVAAAYDRRLRLGLPSADTTAFRLVNSEGDGLPGLIVDIYGDTAAVQFSALGMKRRQDAVVAALRSLAEPRAAATGPTAPRPAASRRPPLPLVAIAEVGAGSFSQIEGFASQTRILWGEADRLRGLACRENGLDLRVDLEGSQKTGLFLDQRRNRARLAELCRGAQVLDVYSHVGGFALNALKAGAKAATCVDASARALSRAQEHATLNGFTNLTSVESDAFRFLEVQTPQTFDVVVLDPPKFARSQRDLPAALKGYQRLNALGLNAVKPRGLLASCSCSQLVDEQSFERMLAAAAFDAGRRVTVLEVASQGADHPLPPAFPEGRYLKFYLLSVD